MLETRLDTAAKITDKLLREFGPDDLGLVEQIGQALFRASLSDGRYVMAGINKDGRVWINALEVSP